MPRNDQLIRQLRLLQILEQHRYGQTIGELRETLVERMGLSGLSERTVRRDLESLQSAGFDVRTERCGRHTKWVLGKLGEKVLHHVGVNASELVALWLGKELLAPLAGTMFWEGIESFWQKIRDEVPEGVLSHFEAFSRVLRVQGVHTKSYEDKKGMLQTIHRCIDEHRVLRANYRTVGKPARVRRIEPYGMVIYQGNLYVVGGDGDVADGGSPPIKQWKLDRFASCEALDEWFKVPNSFDFDRYLRASIGPFAGAQQTTYRIRIDADAAPWVLEDPWHADQVVERQADGSVIITLQAAHSMAVIPRVLALGTAAELLEPVETRRQLAESLRRTAALYASKDAARRNGKGA